MLPRLNLYSGKEYRIRIVTEPYPYFTHAPINRNLFNSYVYCSGTGCVVCSNFVDYIFSRAKLYWFVGVIDRNNNSPAMITLGKTLLQQCKDLMEDKDFGSLDKYDVRIRVGPYMWDQIMIPQPPYNSPINCSFDIKAIEKDIKDFIHSKQINEKIVKELKMAMLLK